MEVRPSDWDAFADTYHTNGARFTTLHATDLISALPSLPTMTTILEVACGTGAFAKAYLDAFPTGIEGQTIIMSDFSAEMVNKTQTFVKKSTDHAYKTKFKFSVMDGRDMNLIDDESIDMVLSVFGVFLIPPGVLGEVWRVLKKGGIFGTTAWTDFSDDGLEMLSKGGFGVSFHRVFGAVFASLAGKQRVDEMPFSKWSDESQVKEIFEGANFGKVHVHKSIHSVGFRDAEVLWTMTTTSPGVDLSKFEKENVDGARASLEKVLKLDQNKDLGVIYLITASNIAIGTK